jgi:hypothetical protein
MAIVTPSLTAMPEASSIMANGTIEQCRVRAADCAVT